MAPATAFRQAVEVLKPGATGRDIAELLDGKISRTGALDWWSGRRGVPKWAMDLLAAKIQARIRLLQATADNAANAPERPGLKAGAINLARWRQRSA